MRLSFVILLYLLCRLTVYAQVPDISYTKHFSIPANLDYFGNNVIDAWGNTFITGSFANTPLVLGNTTLTSTGDADIFVAKLSPGGEYLWAKSFGGNAYDEGKAIATDAAGNCYVTGTFRQSITFGTTTLTSAGQNDIFVLKLDSAGTPVWAKSFSNVGRSVVKALHTDNAGNSYVTGSFWERLTIDGVTLNGNQSDDDGFIVKLDPDGNRVWARIFGGRAHSDLIYDEGLDEGRALCTDPDGNCYLVGYYSHTLYLGGTAIGTLGRSASFITKISPNGDFQWLKSFNGNETPTSISTDASGNVYVSGNFSATTMVIATITLLNNGGSDIFLTKLTTDGAFVWAKSIGGPQNDGSNGLYTDASGNCYLTGYFTNTITFGDSTFSGVNMDVLIAKTDTLGNPLWAATFGGNSNDQGLSIRVDAGGNCHVYACSSWNVLLLKFGDAEIIPPGTAFRVITGNVFREANTNCTTDPGENPLEGMVIKALPGPYYAITDRNGNYGLRVPSDDAGTYAVSIVPSRQAIPLCPAGNLYNISIQPSPDTISGYDFGLALPDCHQLDVQIASGMRRRCFSGNTLVSYRNKGSRPASEAYLLVEFPEYVVPLGSSGSWTAVDEKTWRFDLGDVAPGQAGTLYIRDSVVCDDIGILGLAQCTRATAYPPPGCLPDVAWSGAEIGLAGHCDNGTAHISIFNKSVNDMTDSTGFEVYLDSVLAYTGNIQLVAGDTLRLEVLADGYGVHVWARQVAAHPTELFVTATVEACSAAGEFTPSAIASHFSLSQQPHSKIECLTIQGSYDPNDKQVSPLGFTEQQIVPPGTALDYAIRFQNTGSDTAFTVYITDTLSTHLDPERIEMGIASHPCVLGMHTTKEGKTILHWQFDNIRLPDSTTNPTGSQGFLRFRIFPKEDLPLGTQVLNEAAIYFDFNPPVITNRVLSTFDSLTFQEPDLSHRVRVLPDIITSLSPLPAGQHVQLYPNPVSRQQLSAIFGSRGNLRLYTLQGQLVFRQDHLEGIRVLPLHLPQGFYIACAETETEVTVIKLVVE